MRTFFLDKQDIVRVTGERFYKRGYDYYKKGRVYGLNYNPSINSWRAHVRGTETYNVRVFFFEKDELESSCDCQAYATHYTCKHIAAVLFAIGDDSWKNLHGDEEEAGDFTASEQWEKETFASRIIDTFSNKQALLKNKRQQLETFYTLTSKINPHNQKYMLEIGLKIGTTKLYEVKNIRELLSRVKKGKSYSITPSFNYSPENHQWQPEDKLILQTLIAALEQELLYENGFGSPISDKRTILLPPKLADEVISAVAERPHLFQSHQKESFDAIVFQEEMKGLQFQIEKPENGNFQLDVSGLEKYLFFESYGYLFANGTFYRLSQGQTSIANQIYAMLPYQQGQAQTITNQNMEQFLSQVVPKFEELGEVTFAANTKEHLTAVPLETKIFLEEENNSLIANAEFHYGDQVIYPYQPRPLNSPIIKRDGANEQNIIQLLEKAGFLFIQGHFQLFHSEKIYFFLKEEIEQLQEHADVRVSAGVKAMFTGVPSSFETKVEVDEKTGMLDISFDISGLDRSEIIAIMEAMIEKKKFYRIPNGALLNLEEEAFTSLQSLTRNLKLKKADIKDGELHVPAAKSFQIEEALQEPGNFSESFQTLLQRLKNPQQLSFPLPEGLQAEMRDYQLDGYQWLKALSFYQLGGILADDMGLGKTLQTICYLLSEKEVQPDGFKSLIVAPASLLYNWEKEFEKFAPSLRTIVVAGSKSQRLAMMEQTKEADVIITSYPLLRKDSELYNSASFHSMILDEAQAIKNDKTLTAKAVRGIPARNRFALSGTPIENSLDELWALFATISPGLLPGKKEFLSLESDYIAKVTRPFILRRLKKDVLHELPDKIETVQYSELTSGQKKVYAAYLEKMQNKLAETIETKGFQRGKLEILAGLTRLRQICCHPSLFLENYKGKSGKQEQLLELLQELKESGKRTLVFSQFSSMLTMLGGALKEAGIDAFYLDGSTSSKQRLEMVERFNAGEKTAFLISLKAGGTGLNLTGADTVILYDLWWNPAIEEQAAGRAHRMGQKNVVQVIRLIATGTIEEKIFDLQQKKRALVDQIIQPGESMLSALSEEELKELLQLNTVES